MKHYTNADLLLMCGEMTAQELRTVRAVLRVVYKRSDEEVSAEGEKWHSLLRGVVHEMAVQSRALMKHAEGLEGMLRK